MASNTIIVSHRILRKFVTEVFIKLGVPDKDADIIADVIITADLRGIESHGVARINRYITRIQKGLILPKTILRTIHETPATLLLDAGNGLGQVAGYRAMERCINKAKKTGLAFVAVRNSNHFGIAGYYAMMALPHNMIGISMSNSRPMCVPTYGRKAVIGTNPISFAAPAYREKPFVLDMATSVIPVGKIELFKRLGKKMPLGWAVDRKGCPTTDPAEVLAGGGVLPLGGTAEFSGYKGYGLSVMLDVLCGVLAGASFLLLIENELGGIPAPSNLGHLFGAIDIKAFRPVKDFKQTLDEFIKMIKNSAKAKGQPRILIAGEKEFEITERRRKEGISLHENILTSLEQIGNNVGVTFSYPIRNIRRQR